MHSALAVPPVILEDGDGLPDLRVEAARHRPLVLLLHLEQAQVKVRQQVGAFREDPSTVCWGEEEEGQEGAPYGHCPQ